MPLTLISFVTITKWWYVDFIDGPDEFLTGFPLPFVCPGWHTSLSLQIFVFELIIDILTYFTFWFLVVYGIKKVFKSIKLPKILTIVLLSISGLILIMLGFIALNPDNIYTTKREYEMEIIDTGWSWQDKTRPDNETYKQQMNKEE